ncbi:MAG: glycoside hydrolase family 32 protein, partial [Schleiferilactobacillus harbinensis]
MMIEQTEALDRANRYIEQNRHRVNPKYRDQYHLMAPVGWINDPNGAVYYHGAYHLFYQYYPYASNWGPMHWGHARSKDLVHWEDLPVALAPDQAYDRDGCFSGSAIVHHDRLYLLYTGHVVENGQTFQTQCLAVSDDGIHFVKFRHNPVIAGELLGEHGSIHDFRDPKVFAHDGSFYAVAATKTTDNRGRILLFKSVDLQHWDFFSTLLTGTAEQGIMWECPDFFHLDGYDVLLMSPIQIPRQGLAFRNVSSTMACIGQMDWTTGELTVQTTQEIDYGLDFYAPQTLVDEQGRRIMIAWMQMWNRTMPTHELDHGWAGAMTLPRELRVKEGRLIQKPVSL